MNFDLKGMSVFIGMPTNRDLHPLVVKSLLETQETLLLHGIPVDIEMQAGGSVVHYARTKVAHNFLQGDAQRLFWIDSDITWRASDFMRLLAFSTKLECVAAVYPAKQDPVKFFINSDVGTVEANEFGCLPIKGFGMGFCCVQRKVMEQLAARAPKRRFHDIPGGPVPYIFRGDDVQDDEPRGEDMSFLADIASLGYPVWVDPSIPLGHVGPKEYSARLLDYLPPVGVGPSAPST